MKTELFTILLVLVFGVCPVKADLVFDSGYNIFDDSYPYYNEVWVINDAHLDVLGGAVWKLELMDYATANIYNGDIEWLFIQGDTVINIYAVGDTLEMFAAGNESLAYLYAYDVTYHPSGGLAGEGWIEGIYISNDTPFSFSFYNDVSYSHINIVPEPSTLLFFGLGFLVLLIDINIYPVTIQAQHRSTPAIALAKAGFATAGCPNTHKNLIILISPSLVNTFV